QHAPRGEGGGAPRGPTWPRSSVLPVAVRRSAPRRTARPRYRDLRRSPIALEEDRDLLLGSDGQVGDRRSGQERVRVGGRTGLGRPHQVVAEERGPIDEI